MKKIFLTILFTLVLSGGAFADHYRILYKDSNTIHIQSPEHFGKPLSWKAHWHLATDHCKSQNKYWFQLTQKMFGDKIYKHYKNELKNMKGYIGEYICSAQKLSKAQSITGEYRLILSTNYGEFALNNSNTNNEDITFNIAEKKKQCEAIGFKPETEKFADCVLRLVELDVKQQTQNQIAQAQNSGNEALVKQLKRQNNLQSSQALIDLGQQLMNPKRYNSNIYMPQTTRCTMQGFGTFATMRCR